MEFYEPYFEEYLKYTLYFKQCLQMCAEMSFLALWSCSKFHVKRAFYSDLFWHTADWQGKRIWLPPVGEWERSDWEELLDEVVPAGTVFGFVPEFLALKWRGSFSDKIKIEEMRSEWDYMYDIEKEVLMEGQAFRSIRKLCRRFTEKYPDHIYSEITSDDIDSLISFQKMWMGLNEKAGKINKDLLEEHDEAVKILNNWHLLPNVIGAKITIGGEIASYIVVEAIDDYIVSGHILKGNYEYAGIYQIMRHLFIKNALSSYSVMNAWGDGGYENLRQAKLNMNPIGYVRKYIITWK